MHQEQVLEIDPSLESDHKVLLQGGAGRILSMLLDLRRPVAHMRYGGALGLMRAG